MMCRRSGWFSSPHGGQKETEEWEMMKRGQEVLMSFLVPGEKNGGKEEMGSGRDVESGNDEALR